MMDSGDKTKFGEKTMLFKIENSKTWKTYENSKNFQDSRVGTDTPGPGEAVFAIRFNGKPQLLLNNKM